MLHCNGFQSRCVSMSQVSINEFVNSLMMVRSTFLCTFPAYAWDARRPAGCSAGRPAGRSSAARGSSAAPKRKSFDRGGLVWPPRSNVTNDRLRGGSGGALAPQTKNGGSAPQPKKLKDLLKDFFVFEYGWTLKLPLVKTTSQLYLVYWRTYARPGSLETAGASPCNGNHEKVNFFRQKSEFF